jgi:MtrB/PioB family decaheme-associated outer membrane protein
MYPSVFSIRAHRTLVAMAVYAVCVAAQAQSVVETTVSVGLGALDGSQADRAQFGQYRGLPSGNAAGLLGLDYSLRDQEAGKSVDFTGSNILGDNRELNFVWKQPGSWKFSADYSQLVRFEPNTLITGAGVSTDLKTKRSGLGLGLTKIISPELQVQVDLKSQDKEGNSALSMAYLCATAVCNSMLPEPVKANHTQVEARVSYALEKFRVNAGYYGSYYRNSNAELNTGAMGLTRSFNQLSLALPPDNESHQLDVSGSYDFSKATRGTFKLAWSTASQNDDFSSAGLVGPALAGNTVLNSAGAKIDTTLAKLGFTSKPLPQLSLLGDLRYENKDDQTPLYKYNLLGLYYPSNYPILPATNDYGTNRNLPNTKVQGKLEATWRFNPDYRGTLGADYESIDRGTVTASSLIPGISALRQKTDETGVRAELRGKLSDDFSGAVTVSSSTRDGSNWLQSNTGIDPLTGHFLTGVTSVANPAVSFAATAGTIFMPTLANRQRDKVKLFADWQASEKLNMQFSAATGTDKFSPPAGGNGLRESRMGQLSVDGSYAINDSWALTAYLSQSTQTLNQSVYAGTAMAFDNTNLGASIGVTGKANSKVNVGASLSYVDDRSAYAQSPDAAAPASVAALLAKSGGLPDITYQQTALKLFATYALEKKSSVRLDLIHQRTSLNDWTWGYNGVPFSYSDGATVSQNANQNVSYVGVTYVYQLP